MLRASNVHVFTMREVDKHGIAKATPHAPTPPPPPSPTPLSLPHRRRSLSSAARPTARRTRLTRASLSSSHSPPRR